MRKKCTQVSNSIVESVHLLITYPYHSSLWLWINKWKKNFKGNLQENQKLNLIHTDRYAGGLATRPWLEGNFRFWQHWENCEEIDLQFSSSKNRYLKNYYQLEIDLVLCCWSLFFLVISISSWEPTLWKDIVLKVQNDYANFYVCKYKFISNVDSKE